jgi:hypothetical protein
MLSYFRHSSKSLVQHTFLKRIFFIYFLHHILDNHIFVKKYKMLTVFLFTNNMLFYKLFKSEIIIFLIHFEISPDLSNEIINVQQISVIYTLSLT